MNRRQKRRILEGQLHAVRKKEKEIDKEIHSLEARKERLRGLIEELEMMKLINKGFSMPMSVKASPHLNIKQTSGIWMVKERNDDKIEMIKFYDLVRDVEPPALMALSIPKNKPPIGDDGKEVTFNVTDLVACAYLGDVDVVPDGHENKITKGNTGFHFANVEPKGEETKQQYAVAIAKILCKELPSVQNAYLIVDGNFRRRD